MSNSLDFYFDFGSPTAYLAYKRLLQLREQYELTIEFKPVLLGGLFKATGNQSPVAIPAKGAYMNQHDLPRFAKRYQVPLNFNPYFPINTLNLMRGALAAEQLGCLEPYMATVYQAMWVEEKNMGEIDTLTANLNEAGLDAAALISLSQSDSIKAKLIELTQAGAERGLFGAPTMFMGDEMYFGQDRLDFIEEKLIRAQG